MSDEALFAAQAAWLERLVPGHRIRRIRWGGGTTQLIEAGPGLAALDAPVLLIHGGLGEAFQWAPILGPLAQQRRVLAVDRPGHGLADPFDLREVDFMAHAASFVGDVLDAAAVPTASIVGSSMGGLYATAFAHAHPERVLRSRSIQAMQELEGDPFSSVVIARQIDSAHTTAAGGPLDLKAVGKERS